MRRWAWRGKEQSAFPPRSVPWSPYRRNAFILLTDMAQTQEEGEESPSNEPLGKWPEEQANATGVVRTPARLRSVSYLHLLEDFTYILSLSSSHRILNPGRSHVGGGGDFSLRAGWRNKIMVPEKAVELGSSSSSLPRTVVRIKVVNSQKALKTICSIGK